MKWILIYWLAVGNFGYATMATGQAYLDTEAACHAALQTLMASNAGRLGGHGICVPQSTEPLTRRDNYFIR